MIDPMHEALRLTLDNIANKFLDAMRIGIRDRALTVTLLLAPSMNEHPNLTSSEMLQMIDVVLDERFDQYKQIVRGRMKLIVASPAKGHRDMIREFAANYMEATSNATAYEIGFEAAARLNLFERSEA